MYIYIYYLSLSEKNYQTTRLSKYCIQPIFKSELGL